jgi:hypothetical protein
MRILPYQLAGSFSLDKFALPGFVLPHFAWIFKPETGDMVWIPDHLSQKPGIEDPPPPPSNLESRKAKRLNYGKKVEAYPIRPEPSDNAYHLVVQDISQDGVCLKTNEPFAVGQILMLQFKVPGQKVVLAPARVVWAQKKASGLEFLTTDGLEELLATLPPNSR